VKYTGLQRIRRKSNEKSTLKSIVKSLENEYLSKKLRNRKKAPLGAFFFRRIGHKSKFPLGVWKNLSLQEQYPNWIFYFANL